MGDVQVVGGNGRTLDLRGFVMLPTAISTVTYSHEYGIVRELPIDVIIGSDVLIPHQCTLQYTLNEQKKLELNHRDCSICAINRPDPESGTKAQLKFTIIGIKSETKLAEAEYELVGSASDSPTSSYSW